MFFLKKNKTNKELKELIKEAKKIKFFKQEKNKLKDILAVVKNINDPIINKEIILLIKEEISYYKERMANNDYCTSSYQDLALSCLTLFIEKNGVSNEILLLIKNSDSKKIKNEKDWNQSFKELIDALNKEFLKDPVKKETFENFIATAKTISTLFEDKETGTKYFDFCYNEAKSTIYNQDLIEKTKVMEKEIIKFLNPKIEQYVKN